MPQQNSMIYITDTDYYILNSGGGYNTIVGNGDIYITNNDYYLVLHGSEPSDNLIEGLIYRRHDGEPYTNEVDYYLNLQNLPLLNILITAGYNLTPDFYFYDNFEYPQKTDYRTDTDYYFYNKEHRLFKTDYRTDTDYYFYNKEHKLFKTNYKTDIDYYFYNKEHKLFKTNYKTDIDYYFYNLLSLPIRSNPMTDYKFNKNHYLNTTGGLEYKNLTLTQFLKGPSNYIYIPEVATGMFPFESIPQYIKTMLNLPMFKLADYYLWGNQIVQFSKNLKVTNKLEYNIGYDQLRYKNILNQTKTTGIDHYIINGVDQINNDVIKLNKFDHREYKLQNRIDFLQKTTPKDSTKLYQNKLLNKYKQIFTQQSFSRPQSQTAYSDTVDANIARKKEETIIQKYNYNTNDIRFNSEQYEMNHIKSEMTGILHLKNSEEYFQANKIKDDSMDSGYMKEYNLIKFYIEDVYNSKFITMPAYLQSLADEGGNAKIQTINYVNGIYPKFLYTGVQARKINFSFKLVCTSRALLKNYAQKINYLRSLTYPNFNKSNTNIKFPIAPIVKLTIGDIVCDMYGMFQSIIPKWDMNNTPWNIDSFDFTMGSDGVTFTAKHNVRSMQIPYIATIDCSFLMMHYRGQQMGGSHYNLPLNWLKYVTDDGDAQWDYNNGPGTEFPPV